MRVTAKSFALYALLLLAPAAFAQGDGDAPPGEAPLVAKARALVEKIDGAKEKIGDLETQLESAQGEGRILVNRQLAEVRLQGLEDIHELCDNIVEQEPARSTEA